MYPDCIESLECYGGPKDGEKVLREADEWRFECGDGHYSVADVINARGKSMGRMWLWRRTASPEGTTDGTSPLNKD